MPSILSNNDTKGLVCVITKNIGKIIEDPVNLYKTIYVDDKSSPINQNPEFEHRYSMSLITSNSSALQNSSPVQNTTSI